jgi:hypothetical protein
MTAVLVCSVGRLLHQVAAAAVRPQTEPLVLVLRVGLVGLDTMFQRLSVGRHFTRLAAVAVLVQQRVAQAVRRLVVLDRLVRLVLRRQVRTRQVVAVAVFLPQAQVAQASSM